MSLCRSGRTFALSIVLAVCMAVPGHAQDLPQAWVPELITLPADTEVISSREVGSAVRMFSIATEEDPIALLEGWAAALRDAGYVIETDPDESIFDAVEFSGEGLVNAKIAVSPTRQDGRAVIEFDATLP
ncbi:hypothetical protein [Pseudoruegeria sp. HB172150]|uniref:hypothetical protein n=1 Tax=Pseudoruegeria sp. HB172150 TaxID=2721164 RepID=UPI0015574FAA|nr:hypothetical protein [Pseudoruegeria sp. HB172150]